MQESEKEMKRIAAIMSVLFLSLVLPVFKAEAQVPPTLTSLQPESGCAGDEITVDGLSGFPYSFIGFYKDNQLKARVSANPIVTPSPLVNYPLGLQPVCIGFKFLVPDIMSDVYDVRLEHSSMGMSEPPKKFTVVASVTAIRSRFSVIEIQGTGFNSVDLLQKNEVRLEGPAVKVLYPQTATQTNLIVPLTSDITKWPFTAYKIGLRINSIEARFQEKAYREFILRPHINFLKPNQGSWQDNILIGGTYFDTDPKNVKIFFYQQTNRTEISPDQILLDGTALSVKLPQIPGGVYEVSITVKGIESDNRFPFTVYERITPTPVPPETTPTQKAELAQITPTPLSQQITPINPVSTQTPAVKLTPQPKPTTVKPIQSEPAQPVSPKPAVQTAGWVIALRTAGSIVLTILGLILLIVGCMAAKSIRK